MLSRTIFCGRAVMCAAAAVLILRVSAAGEDAVTGTARIHPFLDLAARYDTNIYLTPSGTTSSFIGVIRPGLFARFPAGPHRFQLGGWSEILRYSENPSTNNTVNNYANFLADLKFPSRFALFIEDNYAGTTDPATSELTQRVYHNENYFSPRLSYTFSRFFAASLRYRQRIYDYVPADYKPLLNRRESDVTAELAFTVSPKTSVLAGYSVGGIRYGYATNLNSSRNDTAGVGVRGQLTGRTAGEIKAGVTRRVYTDLPGVESTLPVLSLTTDTRFSERTALKLTAFRNFEESVFQDNRYYVANGIRFTLAKKIAYSWDIALTGDIADNQYPLETTVGSDTFKRRDLRGMVGVELAYLSVLSWLKLSGGWWFVDRDSNIDSYDYRDAVTELSVKIFM